MRVLLLLIPLILLFSCKPTEDLYLYEVNQVDVSQTGVEKNNLKSDLEFISLAYADLFGQPIPENILNQMVTSYNAMGDKGLIADILIRNLLNQPSANVPSNTAMRNNVDEFIDQTYQKFFVREASEYERWYFTNLINDNPDLTPEMIWYAFLTSDEYRFY